MPWTQEQFRAESCFKSFDGSKYSYHGVEVTDRARLDESKWKIVDRVIIGNVSQAVDADIMEREMSRCIRLLFSD